ncbi:MAG: hypothetical protein IMZ50_13635 [Candidatus Atribacteria bacterium]|nr:hypothetical protein [Candidatus Atribacteria bacterium]
MQSSGAKRIRAGKAGAGLPSSGPAGFATGFAVPVLATGSTATGLAVPVLETGKGGGKAGAGLPSPGPGKAGAPAAVEGAVGESSQPDAVGEGGPVQGNAPGGMDEFVVVPDEGVVLQTGFLQCDAESGKLRVEVPLVGDHLGECDEDSLPCIAEGKGDRIEG